MVWRRLILVLVIFQVGCSLGALVEGEAEPAGENPIDNPPVDEAPGNITPIESIPEHSGIALPNLGAAPELTNEIWLNSDIQLRLADLRGKVVLLEMWTFG